MINHFWNLCRTCPTSGYEKQFHSEYRSTYKWHEYSPTTRVIRNAPRRTGVVGGVHDSSDVGFTRTRMSQIPQTHEKILANGSAEGFPLTGVSLGGGRGAPGVVTTIAPKSTANQENKAPPLPPSGQPEGKTNQQESNLQPQTPRKSKSMGRLHGSGEGVTAGEGCAQNAPADNKEGEGGYPPTAFRGHRRVPSDGVAWRHSKAMESEMENEDKFMKRTYKSEYRKKFRPFSQYQYVDGKFHKAKAEGETPNTWYKEVLELRKQAGQYRCRGWGVETASDRMAEIYTKQVELWEQVSRRSSLQALSLASAAPSRPISKAEKEIENSRRSSPIKHARDRPSTAPAKQKPAPVHKPADKIDGKAPQKESTTPRHHYDKTTGAGVGRSVSVGPENRSPKRTSRPPSSTHAQAQAPKTERRPRPTSLTTSSRRKGADSAISHHEAKKPSKKPLDISASPKRSADLKSRDERRQSSVEEEKKDKDGKEAKDAFKEAAGRKSTPEPRFDPEKYEPVVKTPPEPTRVKSPDQVMVKSPDPVNWTVPLDTGKTFTVTSNVPEGEASRGTPSSEHRPPLESRSRQTPEPTKVYQGSLAGTPITTAGTSSSAPSASTATATIVSTSSHLPSKVEPAPSIKTTAPSAPTNVPADILKEPVSGIVTEASLLPPSNTKSDDEKKTNEKPTEISSIITASKPLDSKPLSSIKETSPQPSESPKPYQEMPKPSEVLEAKSSPASSISSSIGLSSGPAADPMTMSVFGSLNGMNGKSSGTPSPTKPEVSLLEMTKGAEESLPVGPKKVSGSYLKCLDDPNFLDNDEPPASIQKTSPGYKILDAPSDTSIHSKPGSYRVLEAPEADPVDMQKENKDHSPTQSSDIATKSSPYRVLEAPMEPTSRPKGSPYRVLEAPDAPFNQSAQPVGAPTDSNPPSLVSPSSGRTVTEALDKARSRFDSFWGGGKDKDPPSKV